MLGSEGVTVLVHTVCSRKNVPALKQNFKRAERVESGERVVTREAQRRCVQ